MTAELVGTAFLLAAVVGSGIMGERLSAGNVAIALLANTIATGAALVSLILTFGSVSGAHFNPAVTLADASQEGIPWGEVPGYLIAQITGAYVGVACAHLMFGLPLFSASRHARSGASQVFSEFVATFGLLSVIRGCSRLRSSVVPFAVGAYITAAYWFTESTSFASPAVSLARAATDTFSGIRPVDVPGFIVAQLVGAATTTALFRWLIPALPVVRRMSSSRTCRKKSSSPRWIVLPFRLVASLVFAHQPTSWTAIRGFGVADHISEFRSASSCEDTVADRAPAHGRTHSDEHLANPTLVPWFAGNHLLPGGDNSINLSPPCSAELDCGTTAKSAT
ncbi:MAG TPA: MIP/aquaporin family protein [Terriglobales bacterium]|nr:MIP/aquaporin family protein [Terriglobales bacterium]